MWEFPCQEVGSSGNSEAVVQLLLQAHAAGTTADYVGRIGHVYSHFRLEADVYLATSPDSDKIAESDGFWHDEQKLADSPLHGAHQKALTLLRKEET